jgi:hypothetical protein
MADTSDSETVTDSISASGGTKIVKNITNAGRHSLDHTQ